VQVGLEKTLYEAAMTFEWVNEVFERMIGFYNFIVGKIRMESERHCEWMYWI
jgi:hypothetical protein